MISEEARKIAAQCRHYAMCKIDFLETGLCPSGEGKHFVSYYPQGRMDIYRALADEGVPVTEGLIDVAQTCTLCGICDKQCHFVTGLRPMKVMKALKEHVDQYRREGGKIHKVKEDSFLKEIRKIVGQDWATNDPATLVAYSDDPFPLTGRQMPKYVVLPGTTGEVSGLVKLAGKFRIPHAVRGNGGSVYGAVFTDGMVIDTNRMRGIQINRDNCTITAGAGVSSFDLQREAYRHGFRIHVAEPAATFCGNLVCTGIFSTWASAYGVGADNVLDAEFVDPEGRVFHLHEKGAPNVFAFEKGVSPSPGICTRAVVPLYPRTDDEEGVLVPFSNLEGAVTFARELNQRRVGLAIGVLGLHYVSTFMSPSNDLAVKVKRALRDTLGIQYAVLVIGDRYAREAIREMTPVVIDEKTLKTLTLGLPRLLDPEWIELVEGFESNRPPYEILCRQEMVSILEAVLRPSPETLAGAVDEDLRDFYIRLYSRPEMTSMVWLNTFRIVSSRMGRHKHVLAFLVYLPLDRMDFIQNIISKFEKAAGNQGLEHHFGFLTPLDFGKRGILEYDYYLDHTDEEDRKKAGKAMAEMEPFLDRLSLEGKGIMGMKYIFGQGCSRKENYLYL
ncbi:MAG TPA: FAD-binding protein [Thermodesulfobacteriota bacterium]